MNELLAFTKILANLNRRLEKEGKPFALGATLFTERPSILIDGEFANLLIDAKPRYITDEEGLVEAIKSEEILIHCYMNGVEVKAFVKKDDFPELYSRYLKMAREMLDV